MSKNALEIAKGCAEKGDINQVFAAYGKYRNYKEHPEQSEETWTILPYQNERELLLLCMQNLLIGECPFRIFDPEMNAPHELQENFFNLFDKLNSYTLECIVSNYSFPEEKLKARDDVNEYHAKVYQMAYDSYLSQIDSGITSVVEKLIQTANMVDRAEMVEAGSRRGYGQVLAHIASRFQVDSVFLQVENGMVFAEVNDPFSEQQEKAKNAWKDKMFEKTFGFLKHIEGLTNDFPYFGQQVADEILNCYVNAALFTDSSIDYDLPEENRTIYLKRLKHLVNLECDSLNAIVVREGGKRISLIWNQDCRGKLYDSMLEQTEKIQKYESDYTHPPADREVYSTVPLAGNGTSGGCYVATAVYGSYDCPQVWTLRRYRDDTLAKSRYGRAFIRTYYAISPTLVKWFGNTEWFKKMWRGKLDRMVEKLQANGVEDTPYEDKEW